MRSRILVSALALVAGVYLLQLYSPLRLHTDAINYLLMAANIADGGAFKRIGPYSLGYPVLLAGLDRIGLGVSWVFVLLNGAFIATGITAGYMLYRIAFAFEHRLALLLCLLTVLCFVLIKYMAIPLSDVPFLGVSMVGLLMMARLERRGHRPWPYALTLAGVLVLIAATISLRTIGIALLPALLWAVAGQHVRAYWTRAYRPASEEDRAGARRRLRKHLLVSAVVAVVGIVVAGSIIVRTQYYNQMMEIYRQWGVEVAVTYNLANKFSELGAMVLNMPWMPQPLRWLQITVGIGFFILIGAGIWTRRSRLSSVEMYVLGYVAILFVFPSPATGRYWLPLLPLLPAFTALVIRKGIRVPSTVRRMPVLRKLLLGYLVCFMLLGVGGLGYTSWITFAGSAFPRRYGNGALQATYELALNGGPVTDQVNRGALRVLQRYEPRARTTVP